jgi:hypothetical protein
VRGKGIANFSLITLVFNVDAASTRRYKAFIGHYFENIDEGMFYVGWFIVAEAELAIATKCLLCV